jgi:DNA-binding transcriptional LysR family regulator
MIKPEWIATFIAVAEEESFAEAARRVHRSPAAVTRAIAALEEEARVRLFNRTTRSVALTDSGARYLEICRRLLAVSEELGEFEAGDAVEPHGIIAVTAPALFGRLHVLPLVLGFLERHPQIAIRLVLLDRIVSLVDEGLDLGIRLGPLPDSSLRAIRVGEVRRGVWASPEYLARNGTPAVPRDLAAHTLIASMTVTPVADRWTFHGPGGVSTVAVRPRLTVNSTDAVVEAAASGFGLACVMSYQVAPLVAEGRLRAVLAEFEPPPQPIHIVHPAGRHLAAKLRLFIEHAAAGLRQKFAAA